MTDLNELLERVKKATGSDKELDRAIERMEHGPDVIPFTPEYTFSIDASVALMDRMLPGTLWRLQSDPDSGSGFEATMVTGGPELGAKGDGATAPLAILAALLSALIYKESQS